MHSSNEELLDEKFRHIFFEKPISPPIWETFALIALGVACATFYNSMRHVLVMCVTVTGVLLLNAIYFERKNVAKLRTLDLIYGYYQLSPNGFLPVKPLNRLPPPYNSWEDLSEQLPSLNQRNKLRQAVDALEPLSAKMTIELSSDIQMLRRAYVLLSQVIHSYVHGFKANWNASDIIDPTDAVKELVVVPGQLAVPFHYVCSELDLPPVITAAATDLWNWELKRFDLAEKFTLQNVKLVSTVTGTQAESFFHIVPVVMQAKVGPLIPMLMQIPRVLKSGAIRELIHILDSIKKVLAEFTSLMSEIPQLVNQQDFYHIYRPLLDGFFPDGIVLRLDIMNRVGVNDTRVSPKGPSAGQSTIFLLFDLLLGIKHAAPWSNAIDRQKSGHPPWLQPPSPPSPAEVSVMSQFQSEMLEWYTPQPHRKFVKDFVNAMSTTGYPSVGHFLDHLETVGNQGALGSSLWRRQSLRALRNAYDNVVAQLCALRQAHMKVAVLFLKAPCDSGSSESYPKTELGTGSTSFKALLAEALSNTQKARSTKNKKDD